MCRWGGGGGLLQTDAVRIKETTLVLCGRLQREISLRGRYLAINVAGEGLLEYVGFLVFFR